MIIFTTSKLSGLIDRNRPNINNMGSVTIGQSRDFHLGQNYHFKLNRLYHTSIDFFRNLIRRITSAFWQIFVFGSHVRLVEPPSAYSELRLTKEDEEKIDLLITIFADTPLYLLFSKASQLYHLGDEILLIHPIRFLGTILSSQKLKECLKKISNDSYKWKSFINGFSKKMTDKYNKDNINCYLKDFSKEIGASHAEIQKYIDSRDWEGLVKYTIS